MNKADSERIAAGLEKKGYKVASDIKTANLVVVNMCSVRQTAVDRVFGLGQKLSKLKCQKSLGHSPTGEANVKAILTGCITKTDRKKFATGGVFDEIINKEKYPNCPPKYQNLPLAYVPISNGCNNACTYCVVPATRGPLICRNYKLILKEVKDAISKGAEEIWLLGQNVNDYQYKKTNFAKLLKMANEIPGDFKFFFISPHPKNFSDELIKILAKCEKFGRRLNLPAQSGDNKILKAMNRPYTVEQYKKLVGKIRQAMPDINLSTDAIVGFPGETKSQFENTVKLFKEIDFDMAYIAKFSPRPGTAALKMKDDVPHQEKERRWKILNEIINKKQKLSLYKDPRVQHIFYSAVCILPAHYRRLVEDKKFSRLKAILEGDSSSWLFMNIDPTIDIDRRRLLRNYRLDLTNAGKTYADSIASKYNSVITKDIYLAEVKRQKENKPKAIGLVMTKYREKVRKETEEK